MKRALALLPLLFCAGCFAADPRGAANLDALALANPPSLEAAHVRGGETRAVVALPPEAASVAGVTRHWQADGFSERIRLATDTRKSESRIDLTFPSAERGLGALPSDAAIRAELAREFPDVRMQIAPPGSYQNAYGDFGLAIGRSGDALRCIYVWQYIEDARQSYGQTARVATPASLRMKLCRSDMTVDQLADAASRLEISLPPRFARGAKPVAIEAREPRGNLNPPPVEAPTRRVAAAGYAPIASATAPEGQRFLGTPTAPSFSRASATAPQVAAAVRAGASDLPPEAFAGPAETSPR